MASPRRIASNGSRSIPLLSRLILFIVTISSFQQQESIITTVESFSLTTTTNHHHSTTTSTTATSTLIHQRTILPNKSKAKFLTTCSATTSSTTSTTDSEETNESNEKKDGKDPKEDAKGKGRTFDEKQLDFTMGYLNKHHRDVLITFTEAFTPLGLIQKQKNGMSGGSYEIQDAKLVDLKYNTGDISSSTNTLTLEVTVNIRGKSGPQIEKKVMLLDAVPSSKMREFVNTPLIPQPNSDDPNNINPIDDFIRRMNRLCHICKHPAVTGKLIQLGFQLGGEKTGELKQNMYLNQVPHNRYVRQYFYSLAAESALESVILCSEGKISNRMKMTAMFPEMNPSMDSYRIGTLLELARDVAMRLAEENLRVRICVQGSMGVGIFTGTPKSLSGVSTLLQRMDWQSNEGEENEGILGNYINFGAVGKEHVVNKGVDRRGNAMEQDDVFIILCPQSMVGQESSIIGPLAEMTQAAGDRPMILLNPDLVDKVSSQGQQNVRGRSERMEFANSFKPMFHFQNIYVSGTSYFPILGAVSKMGPLEPWVAYQRRDLINDGGELYVPVVSTEEEPSGEMIMATFD